MEEEGGVVRIRRRSSGAIIMLMQWGPAHFLKETDALLLPDSYYLIMIL